MIIVIPVFNGGQAHSVGCPHIGFEAVKEIRVLFCTTAIFEVVVCKSVNECPPDGGIIGAGVVADVSLLLDAAQQPYRAAGVQGLVEAADPEDGIEHLPAYRHSVGGHHLDDRPPPALCPGRGKLLQQLRIVDFSEFQRAQGAAINHAVARLGVAGVDSDNWEGVHRYDLPNSWMNRASGHP